MDEEFTPLPSNSARILLAALVDDLGTVEAFLDTLTPDELQRLYETTDTLVTLLRTRVKSQDDFPK